MTFEEARQHMVDEQLAARGITDRRVLRAMGVVPRHLFVGAVWQHRAYDDSPLPIDAEQTISQPYIVALMTELLQLGEADRVLEIGTGSGYQAAVLAELGAEVFSIERIEALTRRARALLDQLGYGERVHRRTGDGASGWSDAAPFDAIVVTAAVQQIPRPLVAQLADGGRLVLPLGESDVQELARIRKRGDSLQVDYYGECRFVKLIGEYGWDG